jgi:hypothetical protein
MYKNDVWRLWAVDLEGRTLFGPAGVHLARHRLVGDHLDFHPNVYQ